MPRVNCRCGEMLTVPAENPEHMDCTHCGARIRLRRPKSREIVVTRDGFIRFLCPCGRRLKVLAEVRPKAGKCPDCGRVVPVPTSTYGTLKPNLSKNEAEIRTEDLDPTDLAELEKWSARYLTTWGLANSDSAEAGRVRFAVQADNNNELGVASYAMPQVSMVKFETGLRVCPRCKKPLHLSADNCRACGLPVPRQ